MREAVQRSDGEDVLLPCELVRIAFLRALTALSMKHFRSPSVSYSLY